MAVDGAPDDVVDADEVVFTVNRGVATIRLNRPNKFNGWRESDTKIISKMLRDCAEDPSIKAVIMTGTGPYYSAGADMMSSVQIARPSFLRNHIQTYNQSIFGMFIDFPKPIIAALNGPAVGVGVTSSTLTDRLLASTTATFHTPFASLGLPPEGCSSFNFPRRLGEANARRLLQDAEKIDAATALEMGLADEVLAPERLMERAQELAEQLGREGRPRPIVEQGLVEQLKAVNAAESAAFGAAITDRKFFETLMRNATAKGKSGEAWVWWSFAKVVPVISRL